MKYLGDLKLGDTVHVKFTTVGTSGAPTQLAGSPVISAYPTNNPTQLTAGITLTVDFDGVTGLNHVAVVASTGNGYLAATDYTLVITTGTVGGTSVVGYDVASFSIEHRTTPIVDAILNEPKGTHAIADSVGAMLVITESVALSAAISIGTNGDGLTAIPPVSLTAAAVDAVLDELVGDGTLTVRQVLRVVAAALAGKLSGAATTTVTIRNVADSADVILAVVDGDGNRSAVTVTP